MTGIEGFRGSYGKSEKEWRLSQLSSTHLNFQVEISPLALVIDRSSSSTIKPKPRARLELAMVVSRAVRLPRPS